MSFIDKHPILTLFLVVYALGVILLFIWTTTGLLWRFLRRNSIRNRNLWLLGLEINWMASVLRTKEVGASFKDELGMLIASIFMMAFNALFSWILLIPALIALPIQFFKWIRTPAKIREVSWRSGNIQYQSAEDCLANAQDAYLPGGGAKNTLEAELEEASVRVEELTREYAEQVYGDEWQKVEEYIESAKRISKERFHTRVIHPAFWAIRPRKWDADLAVGWV